MSSETDPDLAPEETEERARAKQAWEEKKANLPEAARRALSEAEARRADEAVPENRPAEYHGQKGPEPTRYGDWEKKGIISDF